MAGDCPDPANFRKLFFYFFQNLSHIFLYVFTSAFIFGFSISFCSFCRFTLLGSIYGRIFVRPIDCATDGLSRPCAAFFRAFSSHPSVRSLVCVFLRQTMLILSFNARFASLGLAFSRYHSWVGKAVQLRQPFLLGGQYTESIRGLRSPTTAAWVRTLFCAGYYIINLTKNFSFHEILLSWIFGLFGRKSYFCAYD